MLGGDIIVSINGQEVKNGEQYLRVFRQLKAKQAVTLKLYRDGEAHTLDITLGERSLPPGPPQRPKIEVPPIIPQTLEVVPF